MCEDYAATLNVWPIVVTELPGWTSPSRQYRVITCGIGAHLLSEVEFVLLRYAIASAWTASNQRSMSLMLGPTTSGLAYTSASNDSMSLPVAVPVAIWDVILIESALPSK